MKIEEFMEEISKVENYYQKELTEEQKIIYYNELKNLEVARLRYIFSQIYRTLKFFPKVADILEINTNLGYAQSKKSEKNKNCELCEGTGYLTYWKEKEKTKYQYGAICKCRQKTRYESWKVTDKRYTSDYYTPYAEEIRL